MLTVDIDEPFAYLGKDLFRSLGGLINDISHNAGKAGERYRTVTKGDKDPFDVFDYIIEQIIKFNAETHFFIPTGNRSEYDKNPSWQNEDYMRLITRISENYPVGLHPSVAASDSSALLLKEKQRLQSIVSNDIIVSRFHYIKMHFPFSYRNLLAAGIIEDDSMGYPDEPGFRAGIGRPFFFYNILREEKTCLKIFPFQVMDSSLYNNKDSDPLKAKEIILNLINETKRTGGTFISVWHNTSLVENPDRKGWRDVFEFMLKTQLQ